MFKGFRTFLMRGNVVDLAVAVVIGSAFVTDILTPLVAAIAGKPDFSALAVDINGSKILYGAFLNALVAFLMIAAAVYFFIVVPMNAYAARMARGEKPADPTPTPCHECLSEIPIAATRCAHCGSPL